MNEFIEKAIITADWHLREDRPVARTDKNWLETQRLNIRHLVDYANMNELPVFHLGDIFQRSQVDSELLVMLLEEIEKTINGFYFLIGNHDLKYHNHGNLNESSIGVLVQLAKNPKTNIHLLSQIAFGAFHFGEEKWGASNQYIFLHKLVCPSHVTIPNANMLQAKELGTIFKNANIIFTGDYHQAFIEEIAPARYVVNPGCLIRQKVSEMDYSPGFVHMDLSQKTAKNRFVVVPSLDADSKDITDKFNKLEKSQLYSISQFISKISVKGKMSLSFTDNLMEALEEQPEEVVKIVHEVKEEFENDK